MASQCDINYKAAKNQRLHVELCLIKLAHLLHVLELSELAAVDETAKKKVNTEPVAPFMAATDTSEPLPVPTSGPAYSVPEAKTRSTPGIAPTGTTSRLKNTISLNASLPVETAIKVEKSPTAAIEPEKAFERIAFNFENLSKLWQDFIVIRKSNGCTSMEEISLNRQIELVGTTIRLALDNDLQIKEIEGVKYELLNYLRPRLQTNTLDIETRVAPDENKRMPYTPQEKYNYMAEKNPHLSHLKNTLGLDADF